MNAWPACLIALAMALLGGGALSIGGARPDPLLAFAIACAGCGLPPARLGFVLVVCLAARLAACPPDAGAEAIGFLLVTGGIAAGSALRPVRSGAGFATLGIAAFAGLVLARAILDRALGSGSALPPFWYLAIACASTLLVAAGFRCLVAPRVEVS